MLESEARAKLQYYQADYGDWVLRTTPEVARKRAYDCQQRASTLDPATDQECLRLVVCAVHFETIAQCLELLGDSIKTIPLTKTILQDEHYSLDSPDDLDEDCVTFSMAELTHRVVKPRFKIGDPAWVTDRDDDDNVIGYLPVTVVGLEQYPNEIWYMIGFHDEDLGTITTNFEGAQDDEIFEELPTEIHQSVKKSKGKSRDHLKVVK